MCIRDRCVCVCVFVRGRRREFMSQCLCVNTTCSRVPDIPIFIDKVFIALQQTHFSNFIFIRNVANVMFKIRINFYYFCKDILRCCLNFCVIHPPTNSLRWLPHVRYTFVCLSVYTSVFLTIYLFLPMMTKPRTLNNQISIIDGVGC